METSVIVKIGCLIALGLVGIGSRYWLKPDNLIEESVEYMIKAKTGKDIDLSPDTPDKNLDDAFKDMQEKLKDRLKRN